MNNINELVLDHRILQKLIEMELATQSEIRKLIVEELLEEGNWETLRGRMSEYIGRQLEDIKDIDEKIEKVLEIMSRITKAVQNKEQFTAFLQDIMPKFDINDDEKVKEHADLLKRWLENQTKHKRSKLQRLEKEKLAAAKVAIEVTEDPKKKVEMTAIIAAAEGGTREDIANTINALVPQAAKDKPVVRAIAQKTTEITGIPLQATPKEPSGAPEADISTDPLVFDPDPGDLDTLLDAYVEFRNDFYSDKNPKLYQQGEIARNLMRVIKAVVSKEEEEAAFDRAGQVNEQEEEVRSINLLPNFKSDVRVFYDDLLTSLKMLKKYHDAAASGKILARNYKKRLIAQIEDIQASTGILAKGIDAIMGKGKEELQEMTAKERFDKMMKVEDIHTKIVTSLDSLMKQLESLQDFYKKVNAEVPKEEPKQELQEKMEKPRISNDAARQELMKALELLDSISDLFPNVRPFKGQVDFENLYDEYEVAVRELDFSVSNFRALNKDSVPSVTLISLRRKLRVFSEEVSRIFGINPEVPGASPATDDQALGDPEDQEAPANDSDGDGLSDSEEEKMGTNPLVADTDGDGIPDGQEEREEPFVPNTVAQLTKYLTLKVYRDGTVKTRMREANMYEARKMALFSKFIAYVLIFRSRKSLSEDIRQAATMIGLKGEDKSKFISLLKQRDEEVYNFINEFTSGKEGEERVPFFRFISGVKEYIDKNPVDVSKIKFSQIKKSQLLLTGPAKNRALEKMGFMGLYQEDEDVLSRGLETSFIKAMRERVANLNEVEDAEVRNTLRNDLDKVGKEIGAGLGAMYEALRAQDSELAALLDILYQTQTPEPIIQYLKVMHRRVFPKQEAQERIVNNLKPIIEKIIRKLNG